MSVVWERFAGDTDVFSIRISFTPDPDFGDGASPEHAASWGSLQIWAGGQNLCAQIDQGELLQSCHWYMLPFLEWVVENWDPLLHEERLPNRNGSTTGIEGLRATRNAPILSGEIDITAWEDEWYEWRGRHALRSAREGGIFPNIAFRRLRNEIEVSWADEPLAGAEEVRFSAGPGAVLVQPEFFAQSLYEVIREAANYLANRNPDSDRFKELVRRAENIERLSESRIAERLSWQAGLRTQRSAQSDLSAALPADKDVLAGQWQAIISQISSSEFTAAAAAALESDETPLTITDSSQAALLFGSASPTVTARDVATLANVLIGQYAPEHGEPRLASLSRNSPLDVSVRPSEQGYDLAESLHEFLGLDTGWVDVESLTKGLGITVIERPLDHAQVRGCAIYGPKHLPTIVVNSNHHVSRENVVRFTLAHELCHLLFDRHYGKRLAIASGPWAPQAIEQRANAFAAMFLMPPHLIQRAIADIPDPVADLDGARAIAERLRVSHRAAIFHLCNLALMSEEDRDRLLRSLDKNT